ncbi:hypothetical protein MSAN_02292000 [Mycena sanguinolenta]|uniref:Uncharacterized protein n=1 Tax=Mycena sanguinolenta TaxID=230812 RepID=A0A8H7CIH0_9AGAR|nr:hypothetical protein MSAN_02292000 [Mycena sanguinolenta]
MERIFSGPATDGLRSEEPPLWYLSWEGYMTPDVEYLLKRRTEREAALRDEQGEHPIFTAKGFEAIVQYLPWLPVLEDVFGRRQAGRRLAATDAIFWSVDGSSVVYENWWDAQSAWHAIGDARGVVFATAKLCEAHKRIDSVCGNRVLALRLLEMLSDDEDE